MTFPTPTGGASILHEDFVPSIIFAVLYGCMVPLTFYRLAHRRSRTLVIAGCASLSIERIVVLSIRANASQTESTGPIKYMQTSIGIGFLSICLSYKDLVQCFLINATYGTDTYYQAPVCSGARNASKTQTQFQEILASQPILRVIYSTQRVADMPRARSTARRIGGLCFLAFLGAIVTGILAAVKYSSLINNNSEAGNMMMLRAGLALGTLLIVGCGMVLGYLYLPRANSAAFKLLVAVWLLLCTVAIYRAAVLHNTTSSFTSTEPGSLNSPADKAFFYIFQILPEWLSILALFSVNAREIVGSGPWGDWRGKDESQAAKVKRERKAAEVLIMKPMNGPPVASDGEPP
ncbi:hypothetical protein CCMSSC00406_0006962 [Pleurotus cornucopiae]|uniref:Uncharacterized protein n=1 Tax=Pleurotus cornucopiae TaxID=5321 RepID=A0ACB7J0E6_PLECO|nr:hypothetical protein CCMSSC00406_0006962 [Pleurotus cornucopiae]